ncbi:DUF6400 family protein [Streptomyces sp. G-G2]|uniref:DUF6400 family protein n=1 Tax=Streptomyces sp. G-G2 TaxID=3046201 RepID=UPI0024B9BABF|nr:DUF6400 family protein [Streptomyces sp. G-G2]MDJ0384583.1 DUF6400 family protein [Streptomyces sp. G-G2]
MPPQQPDPAPLGSPAPFDFSVDLAAHETLRRAHVMAALGPDWDPVEVLRGEEAAYGLLYSGLDEQQQRVYDDLVAAGVLPARGGGGGRAAA